MSLARHNPKRDANEQAIIKALYLCGFQVTRLSGKGLPDLLLSRNGHWHLAEVKTRTGTLTAPQTAFEARHAPAPVWVLRSEADVATLSREVKLVVHRRKGGDRG